MSSSLFLMLIIYVFSFLIYLTRGLSILLALSRFQLLILLYPSITCLLFISLISALIFITSFLYGIQGKGGAANQWGMDDLFTKWCWNTWISIEGKSENWYLSHTIHKDHQFQVNGTSKGE